MSENEKNTSNFVRGLVVVLILALGFVAYASFFWRQPPYEITGGFLALVALVVLLALSETFDHLAFGSILSLKRKIKEEKSTNQDLRQEASELRAQIVNLVANIQQSQVNNTINAPPEAWAKILGVVPASEPEAVDEPEAASEQTEVIPPVAAQPETREDARQASRQRYERFRAAQSVAIHKYLQALQIPQSERMLDVEFSSSFKGIDPVMDRRIVFDAYVRADSQERFVEAIRLNSPSTLMHADRLYVMLNKIWLYGQAKRVRAELILLLVETDDEEAGRRSPEERLIEYFQPAISNGLLRIETMKISSSEIEQELQGGQRSLL